MTMRYISEYVQHEVYNGSGTDAHGNEIETWATPVDLGIYAFNPGGTSEPLIPGHDRVITTPTIYVPSASILSARDRVTVRSKPFEVDGDTSDFRNPYDASMNGNAINLKAVTG